MHDLVSLVWKASERVLDYWQLHGEIGDGRWVPCDITIELIYPNMARNPALVAWASVPGKEKARRILAILCERAGVDIEWVRSRGVAI